MRFHGVTNILYSFQNIPISWRIHWRKEGGKKEDSAIDDVGGSVTSWGF